MSSVAEYKSVLADWSLALVGAAILGLSAGQLVFDTDDLVGDVLEIAVPVIVGLLLVGLAGWLTRQEFESSERLRLTGWSVAGFLALASLAVWEAYLSFREGRVPVDELGYRIVITCAVGALVGSIVGYYNLRQRRAERGARLAQTAMETSRDGIAVVDTDGAFLTANDALAAMFGLSVAGLETGSLADCFSTTAVERLESELSSVVTAGEEFRGEVSGRRADGGVMPVEVSLAALPERSAAVLIARDVSERKRYEQTIRSLNGVSRDLMAAEDVTEVCELVVQTGRTLFDRDIAGIWLHEDGELRPASVAGAVAEAVDDVVVPADDGSHMSRAYRSGETVVREYIDGDLDHADTTALNSSVHVPLGEYGVLVIASRSPAAFDEEGVTLANLLGADATAALERAERERELQRQTERMEFFNSILRHDVLNGLTVIRTRADVLSRADDAETREQATTILEWCNDVSDIVTRVRRVVETLTGDDDADLEPVDLGATVADELDRLRSTYPDVTYEVAVPDGTLVRANELLGEVVGNVVRNAVEHNDTDGLRLSVTAERDGGTVRLRIADTGTGIDDDRKESVFRRGETGHAKATGSGFGLFFVDSMVEEYGGSVRVEDNDPTGTAFVITFDAAGEE